MAKLPAHAALGILLMIGNAACTRTVKLRVDSSDGRGPEFVAHGRRVRNLYSFVFFTTPECEWLWAIKNGADKPFTKTRFFYGHAPAGMYQSFPTGDVPPRRSVPGEIVVVYITYGYDWCAPCLDGEGYVFRVRENGEWEMLEGYEFVSPETIKPPEEHDGILPE